MNGLSLAELPTATLQTWQSAEPHSTDDFVGDCRRYTAYWRLSRELLGYLPAKPARTEKQARAAETIQQKARASRQRFLAQHTASVYEALTQNYSKFLRVETLVKVAADAFPGLVPDAAQIAEDAGRLQRDKEGVEIDQGIFLSHVLGDVRAGTHLCHAMLLPRIETEQYLEKFIADGFVDLGAVTVERRGNAVHVTMKNARYLNAEDQTTIDATEIGIDLATLDPKSNIAVIRGGEVEHAKYRGRRVLGAGINLTHLYQGKIPFLWFIQRDLGFVHKFMRGVARPDALPDDVHGTGIEKPWIAAVETFAIGGHCQILLTQDYVLAADDAFMTLPARKEGIVPGAANLRLQRFVGDRLARQLVQYERKLLCDSPEGRLICDEIVPPGEMDAAIERVLRNLTSSGAVGAIGNRRAFRVAV
ncbi:MAG TPA: enoyl-CoA hydratase-related protein, partial [Bradyrhizobium sp.]|nr:enoyl-CoA hydratase-related protein [Bradyrhizobium sp.]